MFEGAWLVSAFLFGLAGAAHCFGMCGGIAAALGFSAAKVRASAVFGSLLLYSLGRILTYSFMGFLVGFGVALLPASSWPLARTFAALCLFLLGLYFLGWRYPINAIERVGGAFWRYLQPLSKKLIPADTPLKVFFIGGLWGWLPCGLVYSALALAAAKAEPLRATLTMTSFGIGTLPAILLAGVAAEGLKTFFKTKSVARLMGFFYILFACWTFGSAWYHALAHQHHHHHHDHLQQEH